MAPRMARVQHLNPTAFLFGEPEGGLDLLSLVALPGHVDNGNGASWTMSTEIWDSAPGVPSWAKSRELRAVWPRSAVIDADFVLGRGNRVDCGQLDGSAGLVVEDVASAEPSVGTYEVRWELALVDQPDDIRPRDPE